MNIRFLSRGLPAFAAALMLAQLAQAQTRDKPSVDASGPVENFMLAQKLFRYGVEQKDALSVITATNLISKLSPIQIKSSEKSGGGADPTKAAPPSSQVFASLDDMKVQAKNLAGDNAMLKTLVGELDDVATRNLVNGPREARGFVYAGEQLIYTEVFRGNEIGGAVLLSPLGSRVSLRVYAAGNLELCQARPRERVQGMQAVACDWDTQSTGSLQVVVRNDGATDAEFYLLLP